MSKMKNHLSSEKDSSKVEEELELQVELSSGEKDSSFNLEKGEIA